MENNRNDDLDRNATKNLGLVQDHPSEATADDTTHSSVDPTADESTIESVSANTDIWENGCAPGQATPVVRRRQRQKSERGLASDDDLKNLARVFLETQRRRWPELVERGILPEPTESNFIDMVDDFKARHMGERPTVVPPTFNSCLELGAAYSRFSCNNSNPNSIADQLYNELNKANEQGRFVPWQYVFADFGVSGLDSGRNGYNALKKALSAPSCDVNTVYIDDFSRASRDEIEWWRLAALMKRLRKRLIGASDGFDLSSEHADVMITIYGLLSRLFIKSLRQKVRRGMKGAARRGTSVGKPALGYKLVPARDSLGRPISGSDGAVVMALAVDPDAAKHVAEAFRLFGDDRCTYYQIAELFNTLAAGGSISWRATSIRRLLENPIYIGIQVWNKTCRVKDTETEKEVTVENPRREWVVTRIPQLRIVDNQLWKRVRRRMKAIRTASPLTGRAPSRNERSASTMVSGTLFCGYCKSEIKLARSGKYSSMCCFNGLQHVNGCELSSCKSLRVIEESLVDYVSNQVLTEDRVKELVRLTNSAITLEASRPRIDPKPLRSSAQTLQRRIDKFIELVDEEPDRDECRSLRQHIKSLEQQLRAVNTEIGKAEAQSAPPPAFLRVDEVLSLLNELRGLLNQAPAAAAEVLRDITGPIRITHERHGKGRRGAKWIAEFEPRLGPALAKVAKARLCLDSAPSEFRRCSIWTILANGDAPLDCTPRARVEIDCVPAYVRIAPQALELSKTGARHDLIAAKLGVGRKLVGDALRFARFGITPSTNPADRTDLTRQLKAIPGYAKLAERVAQLRSEADRTFRQIGLDLGISRATARRAFLHFLKTRKGAITP